MRRAFVWLLPGALALGLAFPASVFADAPAATGQTPTTLEDQLVTVDLIGDDIDGDAMTFSIATSPSAGSVGTIYNLGCNGLTPSHCTAQVDYTPNANYAGPDGFTYVANDGFTDSAAAPVDITVTAVNDPPTFIDSGAASANEDAGATSVTTWVTSSNPGGGTDEAGQTISYVVSNVSNPSLFSAGPAVAANGTLSFTPATNANGSSTIDVAAVDDGGTTNCIGACDTSAADTITITINAVNDAPAFTAGVDEGVNEDSGAASFPAWATNPNVGPTDESAQTYSYVISSDSNPSLFGTPPAVATNGTLTFTPAANRFGTATVGVKIHDNGGTANGGVDSSAEQTLTITVTNVDDPPNAVNDLHVPVAEGAAATSINVLANDTYLPDPPETLTIVAVTQGAHGIVAITGAGTGLTYKPNSRFFGSDQFSYTIRDSGGITTDQGTVQVDVTKDVTPPVAHAPSEAIYAGRTMGTSSMSIKVSWSATDAGSGVTRYELWRQIDGGTWTVIALPTATTNSISQTPSVGHSYRYRIRARDFNGNVGALIYGPTFKVYLYQEGSTAIAYPTAWTLSPLNASNSGGYTRATSTAGRSATFTVSARDIAFVAPKSTTRGSVAIYLDNVLVKTVSEKSTTTLYRQILWSVHFSTLATHKVRIVASASVRIDLDCFIAFR